MVPRPVFAIEHLFEKAVSRFFEIRFYKIYALLQSVKLKHLEKIEFICEDNEFIFGPNIVLACIVVNILVVKLFCTYDSDKILFCRPEETANASSREEGEQIRLLGRAGSEPDIASRIRDLEARVAAWVQVAFGLT